MVKQVKVCGAHTSVKSPKMVTAGGCAAKAAAAVRFATPTTQCKYKVFKVGTNTSQTFLYVQSHIIQLVPVLPLPTLMVYCL